MITKVNKILSNIVYDCILYKYYILYLTIISKRKKIKKTCSFKNL